MTDIRRYVPCFHLTRITADGHLIGYEPGNRKCRKCMARLREARVATEASANA